MRRSRSLHLLLTTALAAATLAFGPPAVAGPPATVPGGGAAGFSWIEPTLDDVRQALVTRRITCRELIQGYLDRIEAYDQQGPTLTSIIQVNPDALEEADALDAQVGLSRGANTGRLHCVPVMVKDNIDVAPMATTAGSTTLLDSIPPDDAFIVEQLQDDGAIVLAKVNLDKFAFGFGGSSTVVGQANNAYDQAYGPGGSSSGSGVSVSANLGMLAIGTDTGGSIRVPSSVNGLVGLRPSMRLLSQDGIIPLAAFQDTAGPMCRAVQDCATMLEVMAGYDGSALSGQYTLPQQRDDTGVLIGSEQEFEAIVGVEPGAYEDALDEDGLDGARIGVVRALYGNDPEVGATLDAAIEQMEAAGATVEDVTIPELDVVTGFRSMSAFEFYPGLNAYLQSWPLAPGDTRPFTYEEVEAGVSAPFARTFESRRLNGIGRFDDPDYNRNTLDRPGIVRPRLQAALDNTDLDGNVLGEPYDALLYPSVVSLPREGRSPSAGSNNRLSPFSGFPALSMPAGYTEATADRVALPVGMELLGREFDEATLLRLAYGYQSTVEGTPMARQAPTTTPELASAAPNGPGRSGGAPGQR